VAAGFYCLGGPAVLGEDERVPAHLRIVGGEQDTDIGGEVGANESASPQEDQRGIEARREEAGVYGVGQGDRVDRGRIRSFDAYEGKSGSDPYRNSRLTGHRAKAGFW